MATFLLGHGVLAADRPETIVPQGHTITFYTDVDYDLYFVNGMEAVRSGDASSGSQTYNAGDPVPNYELSRYSDFERALFATVADEAQSIVYIGDQIPNDIHLCEATDDAMCGGGRHICGGVFGRIDDDIVYLACRGVEGTSDQTQDAYGGTRDTTVKDTVSQAVDDFLQLGEEEAGRRLAEMEDARDPDAQEALAYLMTSPDLQKAVYKHRTAEYVVTAELLEFEAMFYGQGTDEQGWMNELPAVQQKLADAQEKRQRVVDLVAASDPQALATYFYAQTESDQRYLGAIDGAQELLTGAAISDMFTDDNGS